MYFLNNQWSCHGERVSWTTVDLGTRVIFSGGNLKGFLLLHQIEGEISFSQVVSFLKGFYINCCLL